MRKTRLELVERQPFDLVALDSNPNRLGRLFSYLCCSVSVGLLSIKCDDNEPEAKI